jgi:hypothetical protein
MTLWVIALKECLGSAQSVKSPVKYGGRVKCRERKLTRAYTQGIREERAGR